MAWAGCGRSDLDAGDLDGIFGPGGGAGGTVRQDGGQDAPSDAVPDSWQDGGPCTFDQDCDDGVFCTMDRCVGSTCYYAPRDMDGDGYVEQSCGGDDCNDLNPQVHPFAEEVCTDGADNDCNGPADCFDPACTGAPVCGCVPDPAGESCGNGKDDDCDTFVDCNDADCAGTTACGCTASEEGLCGNGLDDDCDGQFDCDDWNCFDDPACACATYAESCSNGKDDNCNGLIDCADPGCWDAWECVCQPPGVPEVCTDNQDNDCDGLADCADPDCLFTSACAGCEPEICNDGKDNDCDNYVDCADSACQLDPACKPVAELCNNGKDDDLDGQIDCADPDCKGNPWCVLQQDSCTNPKLIAASGTYTGDTTGHVNYEHGSCGGAAGEAVFYFVLSAPTKVHFDTQGTQFDSVIYVRKGSCASGKELACDDDSGGQWAAQVDIPILYQGTYYVFVDGYTIDPQGGANEGPFVLHAELTANPPEICDNGIDDDGDVYVDCADPDCTNAAPCLNCNGGQPPSPEFAAGACTNGRDDDCDGLTDCDDPDCNASDYYKSECCNGQDDNGNQIVDDFSCRCATDADCPFEYMCYTHSSHSCGPLCDNFFGDVCPYVAPGSYCSAVTHQCEFP